MQGKSARFVLNMAETYDKKGFFTYRIRNIILFCHLEILPLSQIQNLDIPFHHRGKSFREKFLLNIYTVLPEKNNDVNRYTISPLFL
ncbi:hypothetical protein B5G10_01680 [Barnesiella sp. An55]|nr:hypothetical protein B5G10_01680 [Barnesiella sp. An55]